MNFKEFQTDQKLRGGYYTPNDLAAFLTRWVNHIEPKSILEPSCGDGVFLAEIGKTIQTAKVTAFEIDEVEAAKAHQTAKANRISEIQLHQNDFLGWACENLNSKKTQFDAVLGNPPFIRYQYLPEIFQSRSERIFQELDCKFTKHTNAWVPFILAAIKKLRAGGRLAMVVPAEIIHVTHAQSLRSYLGVECRRLVILDPEELWFEGTLQGAVLLMAEKKKSPDVRSEGLVIHPVNGREFLNADPEEIFRRGKSINGKTVAGKWTRAILNRSTRDLLDELELRQDVKRFDDIAEVDVGIVTGANKFFLVDDATIKKYKLKKWAHPMFGRSQHCPGVIYDEGQHLRNAEKGDPTNFVWFTDTDVERHKVAKSYIDLGEEQDLHTRYKCRIRKPWYSVPSVYSTEVGMLKRAHHSPRLILNELNAFTTDTAYRVRTKVGTASQLVYGFINSLTALSAELEGRHYGGGVLELVPSEIEKLLMPNPTMITPNLKALDHSVRSEKSDVILEKQSADVLGAIGISKNEQDELFSGWNKLRNRRQRVSTETAAA